MRRLTLAAMCAALLLSACQDNTQAPLGPSVDDPAEARRPSCTLPPFPVLSVTVQIAQVFPKGKLLIEALAREAIIIALWAQCKPVKAQEAVASFVSFTLKNFQNGKIGAGTPRTSTPAKVSDLIDAILAAVQLTPLDLPLGDLEDKDFGTGFADGTSTGIVIVKTNSGQAAASFQGNAFGQPTVVTILRLANDPQLDTQGQANQFAPFYDYTASNASNNHIVVNGELFVGFCLADTEVVEGYPENIEVGHNPVQVNQGGPSGLPFFEILERLTQAEYNSLGLTACPTLENQAFEEFSLRFDEGLEGLASSAWRAAVHHLKPLGAALLPENAYAFAPRTTGVGGRASSYSPFGVVEPTFPSEFGSAGWSYKQISSEAEVPEEWRTITPTPEDGWSTGTAPFGSADVSSCELDFATDWDVGTTMLLRRDVFIPADAVSITIDVLVDNNVAVFVNGTFVGSHEHEGCANEGESPPPSFLVDASEGPLVPGQINKIFIQGTDEGAQSYLDARITVEVGE